MVFQAKSGVDVEKTVTDTQFRIATNSKLFSILSDSIYTRKIDAVIRELCCNAFDAHVEARQERRFQVTLPNEFNSEFRVRDFGSGLGEDDMQMYTTYGESTKSGSNAYIGAFGIGAKSPFAYTTTFNVTSYHNGMARAYSMFVEDGVPRMTKLGEALSDDPSGLEVFFPVDPKDIYEFKEKTISICALMADKIEFLQSNDRWVSEFDLEVKKYDWKSADYLGTGFAICDFKLDINYNHNYLYIVQGNVCYEMSIPEVSEILKLSIGREYDKMVNRVNKNFYITGFLRVPNGTFVPHPSRERLTFDELTKESLKSIFGKIYRYHVEDAVDRVLDGVKSYYDLHQRVRNVSKLVSSNSRIIEFVNTCQNIPSGLQVIRNYDDWRKYDFPCVQIEGGSDAIYRFKNIPKMNMYGGMSDDIKKINRIYYTDKYPLSQDYRYRVLKDKIQSETNNAVILFGDIHLVFTEDDKASFVHVQSLPKLNQQDLMNFRKAVDGSTRTGDRVTKEEVSFLKVCKSCSGLSFCHFYQQSAEKISDLLAEFPVYWVGSNRRYEFKLGDTLFHLKVQGDKNNLIRNYLEFFVDYIAPSVPVVKNGESPQFGLAILPQGHPLRGILPELEKSLAEGIRVVAADFMNTIFYKIEGLSQDVFFNRLAKHSEMVMKITSEDKNINSFFSDWFSAGMPEPVRNIKQPKVPFHILPNGEGKNLWEDYHSERNIKKLDVNNLYAYLSDNGYPLMKNFRWCNLSENDVAEDLLDYVINKTGRLSKAGN